MDEFLKAWNQINWSRPVIEYKIYYDTESGNILDYTTDNLPGTYIVVDKHTFYCHRFDIRIRDGKMIEIRNKVGKLRPDVNGTPCHPSDITIITDKTPAVFWKTHTYDNI
jgi:hypothetical protein